MTIPLDVFATHPSAAESLNAVWLDLELAQWLDAEALRSLQLLRLKSLLRHAYDNVPFYRRRFDSVGLRPQDVRHVDDLQKLPVLTKREIQDNLPELVARNVSRDRLFRDSTGGSTGSPLVFVRDAVGAAWVERSAERFRRWMGYLPEDKIAFVWGADRDVPRTYPPNQRWLNSFAMSQADMDRFVRELQSFQPRNIRAYASSIYLLAQYIRAHGLSVPAPAAVEASAERLFPEHRTLVEQVFRCPVYNVYGSREVPAIGSECEAHRGVHVFGDIRLTEIVRAGRPAAAGEEGAIVVTDLLNYGMPFIRYEIGDVGSLEAGECSCGRSFSRLREIKGRITNTLTTPDGRLVHGEFFTHLFYDKPSIRSFQVHQNVAGSIEILVQPAADFEPQTMGPILTVVREHFGACVDLTWREVAEIPRTPTGKHLFTISERRIDFGVTSSVDDSPGERAQDAKEAPAPAPRAAPSSDPRPRILLVADVPNWIFEKHCKRLARMLSSEFRFEIAYAGEKIDDSKFDLVYPLEWSMAPRVPRERARKYVTGVRSHISWNGGDLFAFADMLSQSYQSVHVVSRRLERLLSPFVPGLSYLTHGTDMGFFTPTRPCDESGKRVHVGWAGNRRSSAKGFEQYIEPLKRLPGVELTFCGYSDKNLDEEGMRRFYDSIDIYVCSSSTEGNNNSLLEAASMERAIVTTDVGTVPEYLRDGVSARIVEREFAAFAAAVIELRDDPARRRAFGRAARESLARGGWDWQAKAEEHGLFLRNAVERAREEAPPPARSAFDALLDDAQSLFRAGSVAEACDALRVAVTKRPNDARLAILHAQVLSAAGDSVYALAEARRATYVAPDKGPLRGECNVLVAQLERRALVVT